MSEVKLEVGQWYRTLANQIVKCVHVHTPRGYMLVFRDGSCGYYPADQAKEHLPDCTGFDWEPPKPEPKYRPFKNAEEFKPFRDKWVRYYNGQLKPQGGFERVVSYDDSRVYVSLGENVDWHSYDVAIDMICFEDGTPFGVRVDD